MTGVPLDSSTSITSRSSGSAAMPSLALAAVAVVFGGLIAGLLGLIVAAVTVGFMGILRGGAVGGAAYLLVFSGSVSIAHYGVGSPEWTELDDRTWTLAASCAVAVGLIVAVREWDKLRRSVPTAVVLALATGLLVNASIGVRATSAAVVAVMALFACLCLDARSREFQLSPSLLRGAIDITLLIGVALDLSHDLVGGFGGRGPPRFGIQRWIGTTLDPNEFGELALLALGITLVLSSFNQERRSLVVARVAGYGLLVATSGSRTAIALLIVVLIAAGLTRARSHPQLLKLCWAALLGAGIASIVFWSSIEPRLTGFEPIDDLYTLNGRTDIWKVALEERADSPLSAVGFGRTEVHFREVYLTSQPLRWDNISTHNRPLEAWTALGLHTAIALLVLWALALNRARRASPVALVVVVISIASSMMLPGFASLRPGAWFLLPLAVVASTAAYRQPDDA